MIENFFGFKNKNDYKWDFFVPIDSNAILKKSTVLKAGDQKP